MNSDIDYELGEEWSDEQDYLPDYEECVSEVITLRSTQINGALTLSQRVADPGKQWAVYLNALALAGFRQWLATRTLNFSLDETHCVILEPAIADGTSAVCHLQANGFRLCLIALEPEREGDLLIPQTVVDYPDLAAHFYVPIILYEEQGALGLPGFIRQDTLMQQRDTQGLTHQGDNTYTLPQSWLDPDLDNLLLYLSCLDPQAIALPQSASPTLPQRLHELLVQPVLNTAQWFQAEWQTQIEPMMQALNWIVIPQQTFVSAMRELQPHADWTEMQVEILLADLKQPVSQGVTIAPNARAAYRNFGIGGVDLQLYAIVSLLESPSTEAEWSLLLILKHQTDQPLPNGLLLEIRDLQMMQIVQQLRSTPTAGYLFIEVIGALSEQFLVTIALDNGVAVTLPPLQFQPTQS